FHMLRLACCRYHASDRWMGHNPFQKELRPRSAIDLCSPWRQWLRGDPSKQSAGAKRAINNHRHAKLLGQRQDALSRLRLHERVVDLDKIGFLAAHGSFDVVMTARL